MAIPYSRFLVGPVTWYGFLIVVGIGLAVFLGLREERRIGLPQDMMLDIALVAVPCGIAGARLYYVAMEWGSFAGNPLAIFSIWEGGLAIYGAVIGGAIGACLYCWKKRVSAWAMLDMVAPGLLLAQAIGRWGNYFNGEAFGPVIKNPAFQWFPMGVQIGESGAYVWHMATFFYESMWNAAGFLALMWLRKQQNRQGNLFLWYLLIYGSGRFVIEGLRMDSLWLGGVRVSQGVSLLICLVAAITLLWRAAQQRSRVFFMACAIALVAVGRWFCLGAESYGVVLCILAGLVLWLACSTEGRVFRSSKKGWFFGALLLLAVDGAGLAVAQMQLFSPGFSGGIHGILCSLALPCYVYCLIKAFSVAQCTGEGAIQCP